MFLSLPFQGVHFWDFGDRNAPEFTSAGSSVGSYIDPAKASDEAFLGSQTPGSKSEGEQPTDSVAVEEEAAREAEEIEARGLSISGAVLDDAGRLLQGATVVARTVTAPGQDDDSFQAAETQLTDLTDNLGSFKFEDLEDRLYELTATKGEDFYPASLRVNAGMAVHSAVSHCGSEAWERAPNARYRCKRMVRGVELKQLSAGEVRLESRSEPMLRATDIILEPGEHGRIHMPLDWGG